MLFKDPTNQITTFFFPKRNDKEDFQKKNPEKKRILQEKQKES